MVITSLKNDAELYDLKAVPFLIQTGVITDHYRYLLAKPEFLTWMKNSFIISVIATSVSLVISILAGYSLARLRFRGAEGVHTAKSEPCQAVAGEDRNDQGDRRRDHADDEAVLHPGQEFGLGEEVTVMVRDDAGLNQEGDRLEVVELGVVLQRGDHHVVEGEQREAEERDHVRVAERRRPDPRALGPDSDVHSLPPDVAELDEHDGRQHREEEERDGRPLPEIASVEADLIGERGEEVRGVDRAAAREHPHDVEIG